MAKTLAKRPSPWFIVGVIALAVGLVGTAIAGTDALDRAISKSKVKKIANKQINKAAPGLTVGNAQALGGQPASAYVSSSGVRLVRINSNGTIDPAQSKGVTQANVTLEGTSNYCISGLDPAPINAQASIDFAAPFQAQVFVEIPGTNVCIGKQVAIRTFNGANAATAMPTYVALFN